MDNDKKILAALKSYVPEAGENGPIASEIGATPLEMNRLKKEGKVVDVGSRKTGKRGRPPVEWGLPGKRVKSSASDETPVERTIGAPKGAPKLVDASRVRDQIQGEEHNMLKYIEDVFSGAENRFAHELGDYRLLADRYAEIIKQIERRSRPQSTTITL